MLSSLIFSTLGTRTLIFSSNTINGIRKRLIYNKEVINRVEKPKNIGKLNEQDRNVGTGLVGAPACGDVMRLQIYVKNNIIQDAKFKTYGCGSAIASSEYCTDIIKGKSIEEASSIKNQDIAKHLSLPPVKLHCSMLAEDALKSAIENYKSKVKKEK
jgi:nitrogen fixation NifU-like protein